MTADAARPFLIDVRADTRERLLQVAMRRFADNGIEQTSLRSISDAAGNRNKSAVGYHFASKDGLITAVLRRIADDLVPDFDHRLTCFETRLDDGADPSLDEVVLGLLEPVLDLFVNKPYGPDAVKVLARMTHLPPRRVQGGIGEQSRHLNYRAEAILRRLLPGKPAAELQFHLQHAVMATVNGLAVQQTFIDHGDNLWGRAGLGALFLSYAGYVTAGLASRPLALSDRQAEAWHERWS